MVVGFTPSCQKFQTSDHFPHFFFWEGDISDIQMVEPNITEKHITPLKINMELKNHPNEKENHLSNHHFGVPC